MVQAATGSGLRATDRQAFEAASSLLNEHGRDAFFCVWDRWLDAVEARDDKLSGFWLRVADALDAIEADARPAGVALH